MKLLLILLLFLPRIDSPSFQEREAACQELLKGGAKSIPILEDAALHTNLEGGVRAVGVLDGIFANALEKKEDTTVNLLEELFDRLYETAEAPVAERIEMVRQTHQIEREQAALREVVRLKGHVKNQKQIPIKRFMMFGPPPGTPPDGLLIVIGRDWQGGEAGLKYIARVKSLKSLYWIQKSPLPQDKVKMLQKVIPDLAVETRSNARLGVTVSPASPTCRLESVEEDSAAQKAGLRTGDTITHVDNQPIANIHELIEYIQKFEPGKKVQIKFVREETDHETTAELTGW